MCVVSKPVFRQSLPHKTKRIGIKLGAENVGKVTHPKNIHNTNNMKVYAILTNKKWVFVHRIPQSPKIQVTKPYKVKCSGCR